MSCVLSCLVGPLMAHQSSHGGRQGVDLPRCRLYRVRSSLAMSHESQLQSMPELGFESDSESQLDSHRLSGRGVSVSYRDGQCGMA